MYKKCSYKKAVLVTMIILLAGTTVVPNIGGFSEKANLKDFLTEKENVPISCSTYGVSDKCSIETEIPVSEAEKLLDKINELAYESSSKEAEKLQQEILEIAQEHNLLPKGTSLEDFKPRFMSSLNTQNSKGVTRVIGNRGTAALCNFATTGSGMQFPIIVLPRLIPILQLPVPRLFLHWNANEGITSCGSLLTGKGFIAEGMQSGTAIGFWGVGFSVFLPPFMGYGFIGYSLFSTCTAENMEPWPPNSLPIISDESPAHGEWGISVSTNELSFTIEDPDGDKMDYQVTTSPDIGSGRGYKKKSGTYTIPINNLEHTSSYSWTVELTDGIDTVKRDFSFMTEELPFDPFDEGWQYRKKVTIDHSKIEGDLEKFPVLLSTVDTDLRDKAQNDGDDILFMDNVGVANKMYHEIEQYVGSSGKLIAWVNVDDLPASQDTEFYMYYGNPSCDNQQLPECVWDFNYQAVWHLNEGGTDLRCDSTINHRHATPYDYEGDEGTFKGVIGGADDFDGNDDHLRTGVSFDYECRTVSFWFNTDKIPSSDRIQILNQDSDQLIYGHLGANIKSEGLRMNAGKEVDMYHYPISTNTWYCCQMIRDGPDTEYYVNGDLVHSGLSEQGGSSSWTNKNLVISTDRKMDRRFFDGNIDEIRISNIARSLEWISTEYNNQNDPSSFLSFGPEE